MKFLIDEISSVGKVHTGMPVLWKASQNIRLQLFMANSIDTVFFLPYLVELFVFSKKDNRFFISTFLLDLRRIMCVVYYWGYYVCGKTEARKS